MGKQLIKKRYLKNPNENEESWINKSDVITVLKTKKKNYNNTENHKSNESKQKKKSRRHLVLFCWRKDYAKKKIV